MMKIVLAASLLFPAPAFAAEVSPSQIKVAPFQFQRLENVTQTVCKKDCTRSA
jgi:hypothetical protein